MSKKVEQRVSKIIYLTVLAIMAVLLVAPFIVPLIFAGSVALTLYPWLLKLEARGLGRRLSAFLLTLFFGIVVSIPLMFFIIKGITAVTQQLEKISYTDFRDQGVQGILAEIRDGIIASVHRVAEKFNYEEFLTPDRIDSFLSKVSVILLDFFRSFLSGLPIVFLFLLVTIVTTYSLLKYAEGIRYFFQKLFGFDDEKMDDLVRVYMTDSRQVYISNLTTGGLQSLLVASGAAILDIGSFFLVFFVTLILAFIPVIGAAPVAFVTAIIAFLKGDATAAIIMVVVGSVAGVVDNFLRPWLNSFGESRIPPIAAFVCVLGGAMLLGFPGLFIGLLVGSVAYDTLPFFWDDLGQRQPPRPKDPLHQVPPSDSQSAPAKLN